MVLVKELSHDLISKRDEVNYASAFFAHEIKNSLCTINGFAKLLRSKNEFNHLYVDTILNETQKCHQLVFEFMQYCKTNSEKDLVNVNKLLKNLVSKNKETADEKNINLNIVESFFGNIKVNERDFFRVLNNLLQNSMEAIGTDGEITISVSLSGDDIIFEIIDNGPGIPEKDLEKIFVPFFTTKENGTGLGLPYCKKIINLHGGQISISSKVGKGTSIIIALPAV